MAEGKDDSTAMEDGPAVDGSDIVFEFECTSCASDGTRLEGVKFCQECDQFLCTTCIKYHQRLSKSHQLIPAASAKQPNVKVNLTVATKCHFHPDRDIEMYCGTHNMVYCSHCIATNHRSCAGVEEIDDNIQKSNPSILQQILSDIGRVHKQLTDMKHNKTNDLRALKAQRTDLLKEIDSLRKGMNDLLDQLERQTKADLDKAVTKLEEEIRNIISTADDFLTTSNKRKSDLENSCDAKRMFISETLGQHIVSDANKFLAKAITNNPSSLQFERNNLLFDAIKVAHKFGTIINDSRAEATYSYTVQKISKLKETVLSPKYMLQNLPWEIKVLKRKSKLKNGIQRESLGFFLQCNADSNSTSWSCNAAAELRIINQKKEDDDLVGKIQHLFCSNEFDWGFSHFAPWKDLLDPDKGFCRDDKITLQVHVIANAPKGVR